MTPAERSRNLRYKRPALASMGFEAMLDELDAISDKCSGIHWWTDTDDETLLNALDGEWVCADCLLDQFKRRDIYTGEVRL